MVNAEWRIQMTSRGLQSPRTSARDEAGGSRVRPVGVIGPLLLVGMISAFAPRAWGTWSIILIDSETREIAVGSATCLTTFDLQRWLPVVRVGVGAGCAQSFVDQTGQNRMLIWDELLEGTDPEVILDRLDEQDPGHQTRQYGIGDALERAATFTGSVAADWADGVVGLSGTMVYAIQGNILTGEPVVSTALKAVLSSPGGLPEKLRAGMEAARSMGGDGRCSCSPNAPTSCGSPPAEFTKSAHIGFMIDARLGDVDGGCDLEFGCAGGDYYMDFNVAFQTVGDEDPVLQMQSMFDAWRAGLIGRPDAVRSTVVVDPNSIPGNGAATSQMVVMLRDWQGAPIAPGSASLSVTHAPDSAGLSSIGPVADLGGGVFSVSMTAGSGAGVDLFRVVADDGVRGVTLIPIPELHNAPLGDGNGDGDWDMFDVVDLLGCVTGPLGSTAMGDPDCTLFDFDVDRDVDLIDFGSMQVLFTGSCPEIITQPATKTACPDDPASFVVGVSRPDVEYQWFKNGVEIAGAIAAEHVIASAGESNEGDYAVRVTGFCGALWSDAANLNVVDPPVFTVIPSNASICTGQPVELCSAAEGLAPLTYQWHLDGAPIADATEPCVSIIELTQQDVGEYRIEVADGCETAVMSPPVEVNAADVVITSQPADQDLCAGETITLFLVAENAGTFQWQKDGEDIPGANAPFYFKPNSSTDDSGIYRCIVANPCGPVVSDEAVVAVSECATP